MAATLFDFKESPHSPWARKMGSRPGSRARARTPLLDAVPPALKNPTEVTGCLSYVNSYLSQEGLHRRNTLPPVIFDLYSPPPVHLEAEEEEEDMAHRRGRVVRKVKKKQPSLVEKLDHQYKVPPPPPASVSQQTKAALEEMESSSGPADTQLIELATYPGFNPHSSTPLPHGLGTLEQMKRVTSSQTKLATKQEWYREAWCSLFYSPASQAIFLDYFWWFFLHKYQTNQHAIQDLLFTRISNNYVDMLCDPADPKTKDTFFKMYPDIIAQCVYTTLLHAYPNSWNNFDDDFKSEMCQFIYLWQVGTKPAPSTWKRWEMHRLEPPNLPKLKSENDKQSKAFDFDSLLEEAKEKKRREELELKRISMLEERRKMALSKRRSCGTSLGGRAHENRMSVAMDQLAKLGARSVSMAHCSSITHSLLSPIRDRTLDKVFGEKLAVVKAGETELPSPMQQQRPPSESSKEGVAQDRKMTPKHIRITNPEGHSLQSDGSCKGVKVGSDSGIGARGKSAMSGLNNQTNTKQIQQQRQQQKQQQQQQQQQQQKQQQQQQQQHQQQQQQQQKSQAPARQSAPAQKQNSLMVTSQQSTAASSQQLNSTSSFQQQARRTASAPISGSGMASSRPESSYDSTPVPTHAGKCKGPSISSDKKSNEEYFSFKKMALSLKEKAQRDSSTLQGPTFDHVVFNLYGRSPLVRHYLDNKNLTHVNEKEVVVGRTEISEEQPKGAVCYKDILAESKTAGDANRDQFQRHYRLQRNAIISAEKHRVTAHKEHEHNVKRVLANKREVQHLSNELAVHALQSKLEYNRRAVSSVIKSSLQRTKTPDHT